MLNIIKNTINRVFASGVDSDASAFITATGLSGTTQKSAITTLVKDLKSSGLWSKMKAVYPMVTDNVNQLSYTTTFNTGFYKTDGTATLTSNYAEAPDGTNTATRMLGNNANSYMYYNINDGLGSGNRTYSIYLKAGSDTQVLLTFNSDGTTVSQNVTLTSSWQRFQLTKNITNSSSSFFITVENVGSGLDILMWGVQVQFGTTASAYQPILTTPSAFMASQMKYNLKDARDLDAAFRLTWSGGWTYSATGATPNGTNAYANTNLNQLSNLNPDNLHLSFYSRTNILTNNSFDIGGNSGSPNYYGAQLATYYNALGTISHLNSYPTESAVSNAITNSQAYYIGTRTSNVLNKAFRNGGLLATNTATRVSTLPNSNLFIATDGPGYTSKQCAFATIGNGLTDQDTLLLNQIVEKYQVALSRGVQAAQSFYYNSAYSNESNTYLYSTQITGTTQVSAINTLINGLKANNLWTKMKAVYPFVTDKINLLSYTEDFANAAWNKINCTISTDVIASPNGTLTADKIIENTTSGAHGTTFATGLLTTTSAYTLSTYLKAGERNWAYIYLYNGTTPFGAYFNLSTGVIGNIDASTTAAITDAGNGWYRCSVTTTLTGSVNNNGGILSASSNGTYVFAGTNGSGVYVWGAQAELNSIASAYQPVLATNSYASTYQTNVAAQMKFNLVNPQDTDAAFRLAFSGGWTYSTNGAQPNGTNGYADTKLNPSTVLSANNIHLSYYSRTNSAVASSSTMGADSATDNLRLIIRRTSDIAFAIIGNATKGLSQFLVTDSRGLFVANAPNSTTRELYKNSTSLTPTSQSGLGLNGTPNANLYLSAYNNNGVVFEYDNKQCAFSSIGEGLSSAEVALLNQLVTEYQTSLSRNV